MPTINSWNNNVLAANVTFNGGTMSIGTDSTDNAINIGTAASAGRTVTVGNSTGASSVVINCGTAGVTIGTSANAHSSTFGSTNSTSSTTIQSGSGTLSITSTNGAITMNSGTGTVSIGSDATAATYNFATGAGAKLVTLGTTNGASSLALKTGTAGFTLSSATGTIMSSLSTGETNYPLQCAFMGYLNSNDSNVTGNGTQFTLGSGNAFTEVFDQNGDFNTNGTFTAPVTGKYYFAGSVWLTGCTIATNIVVRINTTGRNFANNFAKTAGNQDMVRPISIVVDMTAGDTAVLTVTANGEAADTDDILGSGGGNIGNYFSGYLVC